MAIIDDRTGGRDYALPNAANKLKDDVVRLRSQGAAIDVDVTAMLLAIAAKAPLEHTHTIANVSGLQTALDGKVAVGYHDALDDLSDVSVTGAANGQVLIKQGADWIPIALQVGNVTNLETLLNGKAAAADVAAKADGAATTAALALKAPLASPTLTGTPTAPTATAGTDTTQVATTGFVQAETSSRVLKTGDTMTGGLTAPVVVASAAKSNTPAVASGEFIGSGYSWALRTDTADGFNIDVKKGGAPIVALKVDTQGRVTAPAQPAFLVVGGTIAIATTGTFIIGQYGTPAKPLDIGSAFSTTTGLFTAPVAGIYDFEAIAVAGSASTSNIGLFFSVNGVQSGDATLIYSGSYGNGSNRRLIQLAAGDTVSASVTFSNAVNTNITSTRFMGRLAS